MTLSPLTRLVLVADRREAEPAAAVRRYRIARLDLRSPDAEARFDHLKRIYD